MKKSGCWPAVEWTIRSRSARQRAEPQCRKKPELALAAGDESAIDLLVTDVVTREMGGRQLAAEVARRKPAHVAFLAKPFTPTTLLQKARDIVDDPV